MRIDENSILGEGSSLPVTPITLLERMRAYGLSHIGRDSSFADINNQLDRLLYNTPGGEILESDNSHLHIHSSFESFFGKGQLDLKDLKAGDLILLNHPNGNPSIIRIIKPFHLDLSDTTYNQSVYGEGVVIQLIQSPLEDELTNSQYILVGASNGGSLYLGIANGACVELRSTITQSVLRLPIVSGIKIKRKSNYLNPEYIDEKFETELQIPDNFTQLLINLFNLDIKLRTQNQVPLGSKKIELTPHSYIYNNHYQGIQLFVDTLLDYARQNIVNFEVIAGKSKYVIERVVNLESNRAFMRVSKSFNIDPLDGYDNEEYRVDYVYSNDPKINNKMVVTFGKRLCSRYGLNSQIVLVLENGTIVDYYSNCSEKISNIEVIKDALIDYLLANPDLKIEASSIVQEIEELASII